MEFKDNLIRIREERKLTRNFVAGELGLTRQGYNHYETGKRVPPLDIMLKLCKIFDVDMNELTSYTPKQSKAVNETPVSPEQLILNDPHLSEESKMSIIRNIRALKSYDKLKSENEEFAEELGIDLNPEINPKYT